jgi:hypothetical protein
MLEKEAPEIPYFQDPYAKHPSAYTKPYTHTYSKHAQNVRSINSSEHFLTLAIKEAYVSLRDMNMMLQEI